MSDKEVITESHRIEVYDGEIIQLYEAEEYIYGCSMTVTEWEQLKATVDQLISDTKN